MHAPLLGCKAGLISTIFPWVVKSQRPIPLSSIPLSSIDIPFYKSNEYQWIAINFHSMTIKWTFMLKSHCLSWFKSQFPSRKPPSNAQKQLGISCNTGAKDLDNSEGVCFSRAFLRNAGWKTWENGELLGWYGLMMGLYQPWTIICNIWKWW